MDMVVAVAAAEGRREHVRLLAGSAMAFSSVSLVSNVMLRRCRRPGAARKALLGAVS